jgi:hypothetical protein
MRRVGVLDNPRGSRQRADPRRNPDVLFKPPHREERRAAATAARRSTEKASCAPSQSWVPPSRCPSSSPDPDKVDRVEVSRHTPVIGTFVVSELALGGSIIASTQPGSRSASKANEAVAAMPATATHRVLLPRPLIQDAPAKPHLQLQPAGRAPA